jgi:KUP system potassium uptake protein
VADDDPPAPDAPALPEAPPAAGATDASSVAAAPDAHGAHGAPASRRGFVLLALGSLGIVYGDIGTSPLYAFREAFEGHDLEVTRDGAIGASSLAFWALIIVITIKYLTLVMKADNRGEGGILALTSLLERSTVGRATVVLTALGIFGTALLYGDGMITPAISVLSAVEGLEVLTPVFVSYVVPITVAILVGLFAVQSRGTARIGSIFGPVMLLWFATLAVLGAVQLVQHPAVLAAVNPMHGVRFFMENGWHGYLVLGSVFLAVTGGEALYADMGHFGILPIRLTWFGFVLPALLLNYFGQGALVLRDAGAAEHPFFRMAPSWALLPLVILTTFATVIASQAVISGAFSLTRQAVQLGYLPRMDIEHTSETQIGQIYIPGLNWILMIACIGLVLGFRSSSSLAAAYGVAVTTDMVFTAILFSVVARSRWGWSLPAVLALGAAFLAVDLSFWGASLLKIPSGGWFPIVIAGVVFTIMTTWYTGRGILAERIAERSQSIEEFLRELVERPPLRVPGTAVYLARDPLVAPHSLVQNVKHNKVIHERVVLLALSTATRARVDDADRVELSSLSDSIYRVVAQHGFTEDPDVPAVLDRLREIGLDVDPGATTFFLGRETLLVTERPGMAMWRERLFAVLARNARRATKFFHLPPERVVELGAEIEL